MGNFVDAKTEESLNAFEKTFREYLAVSETVQKKLRGQLQKYGALAKQTDAFLRNFEFYSEEEVRGRQFFRDFSGPGAEEVLQELDRAIAVFADVVYFFKRKRQFYSKYKKLRLKNLDKQTGDGSVTVNNQKEFLSSLEGHILEYNRNLKTFLEGDPLIPRTIRATVKAVEVAAEKLNSL